MSIPSYLEFFLYGDTLRFIFLIGVCVILTVIYTWFLAFSSFINSRISVQLLVFFLLTSLVKEMIFICCLGVYKYNYDKKEHPEHSNYSALKFCFYPCSRS